MTANLENGGRPPLRCFLYYTEISQSVHQISSELGWADSQHSTDAAAILKNGDTLTFWLILTKHFLPCLSTDFHRSRARYLWGDQTSPVLPAQVPCAEKLVTNLLLKVKTSNLEGTKQDKTSVSIYSSSSVGRGQLCGNQMYLIYGQLFRFLRRT